MARKDNKSSLRGRSAKNGGPINKEPITPALSCGSTPGSSHNTRNAVDRPYLRDPGAAVALPELRRICLCILVTKQ
jgi:hypothetical protein